MQENEQSGAARARRSKRSAARRHAPPLTVVTQFTETHQLTLTARKLGPTPQLREAMAAAVNASRRVRRPSADR
jgi:hypothetical protein